MTDLSAATPEGLLVTKVAGMVHVRLAGHLDGGTAERMRVLLRSLPEAVPAIIDLAALEQMEPAELGEVLSVARAASFAGRHLAISSPDAELRDRLLALGVERFALTAAAPAECVALLAPSPPFDAGRPTVSGD